MRIREHPQFVPSVPSRRAATNTIQRHGFGKAMLL
jgi:hypothetical protein